MASSVFGADAVTTLTLAGSYAVALFRDENATFSEREEAMEIFETNARTTRRVFGEAHWRTSRANHELDWARAQLVKHRRAADPLADLESLAVPDA